MTAKTGWIDRRSLLAGASATIAAPAIVRAQSKALKDRPHAAALGFFAQAGQSCYRGALATPKVLSDLGYNVEVVHIDTGILQRRVSRTQAEKAINDGAIVVIGAFRSGNTIAIAGGLRTAQGAADLQHRPPPRSSPVRATSISCATS